MTAKKKSSNKIATPTLRRGESQRKNGSYDFRWTDADGRRHTIYASTLTELRLKELQVITDQEKGLKPETRCLTVNDMFVLWTQLKRGLKDNTLQNYRYLYDTFVKPSFGKKKLSTLVKSDVKRFYNTLADERCLSINTIDNVHTVLHQILDMAVDDAIIRNNPSSNVLKELKLNHAKPDKRRALSVAEEQRFLDFLRSSEQYRHWYPVFALMLGTGLRVGEAVGLRWCDIDFEANVIDINHTLVYYRHAVNGCYCNIHTPKTRNGIRRVPMMNMVKDALLQEKHRQDQAGIVCTSSIDGYTDFVFINRFGDPQHQGTLNKALRRIIRDYNDQEFEHHMAPKVFLPHFSCHILRHTFTTRMCEAGLNIKVMQEVLGHADVSTTLNIYADATQEHQQAVFADFEEYLVKHSLL